jgi:cytochrome-b5 reductase
MDWIRLTKSGKDLTGTGGKLLKVTHKELASHKDRNNAWMAINGKSIFVSLNKPSRRLKTSF